MLKLAALFAVNLLHSVMAYPLDYTMEQPIDHMDLANSQDTFSMRYIIDDQYWNNETLKNSTLRPILFYAGNEGDVWGFYENSGFMTKTLAEHFGALVVFGEHRYFGQSWPFPKDVALTSPYNTHLTIENVMMDYINLIKKVKADYKIEDDPMDPSKNTPVIVFGGSYGGMLAAWLRMKHPSIFQGAIAASAPTCYFQGATTVDENAFSNQVTKDFNRTHDDQRCGLGIKEGNRYFLDFAADPATYGPDLKDIFKTCDDIASEQDVKDLYTFLSNGFAYMAMTDYPYDSSFLEPMPAWPVNHSCKAFDDVAPQPAETTLGAISDRQKLVLNAMMNASQTYFNYTGQLKCYDYKQTDATGNLDGDGWNVLACNQVPMPIAPGSPDSMFNAEAFDKAAYTKECQDKYGITPDYDYAFRTYGGSNFKVDYQQYTNIVFTNGQLDPWMPGSAYSYIDLDVPTFIIKDGAHHLDLREPHKGDEGTNVAFVRQQETDIIDMWIRNYKGLTMDSTILQ